MFHDRTEAGIALAEALDARALGEVVVLALPRGGVPVAIEVARELGAPLDLLMVRKLGAPESRELAIGAVCDGPNPVYVLNDEVIRHLHVPRGYIDREVADQIEEIARRRRLLTGHGRQVPVAGKTAIIVDDGIATGATVRAAILAVRKAGASLVVVATPVAPPDTIAKLETEADMVVCLAQPEWFPGVGAFYRDFRQLADDDVLRLLDRATDEEAGPPPSSESE